MELTRFRRRSFSGKITNLDAVTSATDGSGVNMKEFKDKSVFIEVTGNTGAVTVTIEASPTGEFTEEEVELDQKIYTATNGTDLYSYTDHFPYMRVTTTTQSDSTVTVIITGRVS